MASRFFVTLTILIGLISHSAFAQTSLPVFDSDGYCEKSTALIFGNNADVKAGCIDNEASYHTKIMRLWPQVPDEVKQSCIKLSAFSPIAATYQGLAGCASLAMGNLWLEGKLHLTPTP